MAAAGTHLLAPERIVSEYTDALASVNHRTLASSPQLAAGRGHSMQRMTADSRWHRGLHGVSRSIT
jgi:hypothetical protein